MPNAPLNLSDIWRVLGRKRDFPAGIGQQGLATVTGLFANQPVLQSPSTGLYRVTLLLITTATQAGADTITLTASWTDERGTAVSVGTTCDLTVAGSTNNLTTIADVGAGTTMTWRTTQTGSIGTGRYSAYVSLERLS